MKNKVGRPKIANNLKNDVTIRLNKNLKEGFFEKNENVSKVFLNVIDNYLSYINGLGSELLLNEYDTILNFNKNDTSITLYLDLKEFHILINKIKIIFLSKINKNISNKNIINLALTYYFK